MARYGWDGALNYKGGDYLMVVDSNIGFNKTNAVVDSSLSYDIDLTDLADPAGTLTVTHHNGASANMACAQWGGQRLEGEENYPINACYWNYLRVYLPAGTQLLDATPQTIPAEWMISNQGVNGQVDKLDEEIDGLQAFGTLMVVPGGDSLITSFHFRLPGLVLAGDGHQVTYRLKVKKQPGTIAVPLTIRIHVPNGATVKSVYPDAVVEENHILLETTLRTDLNVEVNLLLK